MKKTYNKNFDFCNISATISIALSVTIRKTCIFSTATVGILSLITTTMDLHIIKTKFEFHENSKHKIMI